MKNDLSCVSIGDYKSNNFLKWYQTSSRHKKISIKKKSIILNQDYLDNLKQQKEVNHIDNEIFIETYEKLFSILFPYCIHSTQGINCEIKWYHFVFVGLGLPAAVFFLPVIVLGMALKFLWIEAPTSLFQILIPTMMIGWSTIVGWYFWVPSRLLPWQKARGITKH